MADEQGIIPSDILGVLDHYGIAYPTNMDHPQICCLFHNDPQPSMTIYPDTNSFYCFGCTKSGTPETIVMKMEGCSYSEAVKLIHGNGYEWSKIKKKAEKTVDIDINYLYQVLAKNLKQKIHNSADDAEKLDRLKKLIVKYTHEQVGPNQLMACLKEIKTL